MNQCAYCKRVLPNWTLAHDSREDHRCKNTDHCRDVMQAELRKRDP